jgi:tetratricopeptide (TPR) repeat protein
MKRPPPTPPEFASATAHQNSKVAALVAQAAKLRRDGRVSEAVAPITEAARLRPDDPNLLKDLGVTLSEAGLPRPAVSAFERALALRPNFGEVAWRLGIAHEARGDVFAAIDALQRAVRIQPSLAGARFRLARLLEEWGRNEEAIEAYRKVKSSSPNTQLGRAGEARALLMQGAHDELLRVLRRAVTLDPNDALALEMLGGVLSSAGAFQEAAGAYDRALALAPDMVGAYYDLVRCRRITEADAPLIARMRAALRLPGLEPDRLSKLHLAIGKALDDLGDYKEAMRAFDAAQAVRDRKSPFELTAFEQRVDRIIARFGPDLPARAAMMGNDDPTPVLILGLPRSGTTLLEQIVSAHGRVVGGDELRFWSERGGLIEMAGAGVEEQFVTQAAADYLALLRSLGPSAARVTDKMPFNFLWAGLIHLAFPRATIIHCRRRLIDTALSIHQTHFALRLNMPTGGEALVGYCRVYERLMDHWRRVLPSDRLIEVNYENLTSEPERVIRRVVAATGLAWDPACLSPERNARVVKTPSKWQARQPIYRTAVDRWRSYESCLGPLRALAEPTRDTAFASQ